MIYFSKQKNERLKDLVIGLLLDSYESRMHNNLGVILAKYSIIKITL